MTDISTEVTEFDLYIGKAILRMSFLVYGVTALGLLGYNFYFDRWIQSYWGLAFFIAGGAVAAILTGCLTYLIYKIYYHGQSYANRVGVGVGIYLFLNPVGSFLLTYGIYKLLWSKMFIG